jgi:hypothetical protein
MAKLRKLKDVPIFNFEGGKSTLTMFSSLPSDFKVNDKIYPSF